MKILHLLSSNKFSGAENVVCQIIGMFSSEPDVEMVYCSPDGPIRDSLAEKNVKFCPITKMSTKDVKSIIIQEKPDIIHAHDMRASFLAACVSGEIPFISHMHGNFAGLNKITSKAIAYTFAALKAKHIFWVSQSSFDNFVFKGIAQAKSSTLNNVIDVNELTKKTLSDINTYNYDVVFVGRLVWEKNPERLIRVLRLLADKKTDVRVAIVGTGDLQEKTKSLAYELGLTNNIDFLGFQSNPLKILHDSKVMLMTSIREGTPMCALEAMALGVPIVSTPTDGMKDLIVNGETGFLSDDNTDLCEKICLLVFNNDERNKMSTKSKEVSKILNNTDVYSKKIMNVYTNIICHK